MYSVVCHLWHQLWFLLFLLNLLPIRSFSLVLCVFVVSRIFTRVIYMHLYIYIYIYIYHNLIVLQAALQTTIMIQEYLLVTWLTTWHSWIRASWYKYENNQQDALWRLIYYSKSALHVSGDVSCRDTSRQQLGWTLPDTVNTVKCSWWWAKTSPETCRPDLE
jgi:hypothetical protein